MKPNRSPRTLIWSAVPALVLVLLGASTPAWPCSLMPGLSPARLPLDGSVVGESPLLSARVGDATPHLTDGNGNEIAIAAEPNPGLEDSEGMFEFYRPAAPLPAGEYFFVDRSFTVDPALTAPVPDFGTTGTLALHIDDDKEPACASDTCGDLSRLVANVDAPTTGALSGPVLVALEITPEGEAPITILRTAGEYSSPYEMLIWSVPGVGNPRNRDAYCGRVAPISAEGELGAFIDLGCDEAPGRGGCQMSRPTTRSARSLGFLALLALGFAWARRQRR